jgi:hypothetical protein
VLLALAWLAAVAGAGLLAGADAALLVGGVLAFEFLTRADLL